MMMCKKSLLIMNIVQPLVMSKNGRARSMSQRDRSNNQVLETRTRKEDYMVFFTIITLIGYCYGDLIVT